MRSGKRTGGARRLFWTSAGAILLLYDLLAAAMVLYRLPCRVDFTREGENTLSPETLNCLSLLSKSGQEVKIFLPLLAQKENQLQAIQVRILLKAKELLREYQARAPRLRLEPELDLARFQDAERWNQLCKEYSLSASGFNAMLLVSGDGKLRQIIGPDDLALYDRPGQGGGRPTIHRFSGERAITAALTRLLHRERKRIYVLEGHREAAIADEGALGLSLLRQELGTQGYDVQSLNFTGRARVPEDCDLLAVLGPQGTIAIEERDRIGDYLKGGGRLLVAWGPRQSGLEALLDSWGVQARSGRFQRRAIIAGAVALWQSEFLYQDEDLRYDHPILEPFRGRPFALHFNDARAMTLRSENGLAADPLLRTRARPASFSDNNGNGTRDPGEEEGAVALAAAVSRPRPERPPVDYQHVDTRIVVLGDVTILANHTLPQYSHRDFILNCVHWLLEREESITVGAADWRVRRIAWSDSIDRFLFWVPMALFPGLVAAAGVAVFLSRRV